MQLTHSYSIEAMTSPSARDVLGPEKPFGRKTIGKWEFETLMGQGNKLGVTMISDGKVVMRHFVKPRTIPQV